MPIPIKNLIRLEQIEKGKPVKLKRPKVIHGYWFMLINGRLKAGPWKTKEELDNYIERHPENAEKRPIYKKFNIPLKISCPYCPKKAHLHDIKKMDIVIFHCGEHRLIW